jgi:Raf kinase inhibitor-like YbhB/YbcL family protein
MTGIAIAGCGGPGAPATLPEGDSPEPGALMTLRLQSSAFADGKSIPALYTCDGKDVSPPLEWKGVPAAAKSLALICEDPDAPRGTWTHWMAFNLPPDLAKLDEAVAPTETLSFPSEAAPDLKTLQGLNDFKKHGYGGPCPPSGTHHYVFLLYALDTRLDLPANAPKRRVLQAMIDHILAAGRLVGTYSR